MEYKIKAFFLCIALCCCVYQGHCLECYECDSLTVSGCGVTWEVPKEETKLYLTKCVGDTTACRKLITEDTYKGKTMVKRTCWNTTQSESDFEKDFFSSCHDMSQGEACYCQKDVEDGKPCNGRQPLLAYWELLSALVVLVCFIRH